MLGGIDHINGHIQLAIDIGPYMMLLVQSTTEYRNAV